jgi:hypothetical protein
MKTKNGSYHICLAIALWLALMGSSSAQVINKTTWRAVDKGMDELLNSGWQIIGHGISRLSILPGTVNNSSDTFHEKPPVLDER